MSSASNPSQGPGGGSSVSPIPAIAIIPAPRWFEDSGGNVDMDVDGSVTPVNFDFAPSAGEVFYLENITFGLDDTGTATPIKYGNETALANGVEIIFHLDGSDYSVLTLKNNGDISLAFNNGVAQFEGGKFMNFTKGFIAKMDFATDITLNGDDGDYVRFVIQDDLSGLTFQRAAAQLWIQRP